MHPFTLLSLLASALLASANPALFPPFLTSLFPPGPSVGSIVSTALATASIPPAVAPAVASAVAAAPTVPNGAGADSIPGLDCPPDKLFDNLLAAIAIIDVILTLLNSSYLLDAQSLDTRDLDIPDLADLGIQGSLGYSVTSLAAAAVPLLSTTF